MNQNKEIFVFGSNDEPAQISYRQALAETKESIGRFKDFLAKPIE